MGRTGRKRQGRVISLVSEGKEQKDREKAKSDQNRLNRILREPSKAKDLQAKLTMRAAMIPAIPSMQMKDMHVIAEAFRMSQVAGYSQKKKRRNKNAGGGNGIDNDKWALRPSQEKQRVENYGVLTQTDRYSSNPSSSKPCPFPIKLRREYIRKRSSKLTDTNTGGTSSSILQSMESMFLESNKYVHEARQRLRRRKEKRSRRRLERDTNDSDADPAGNAERAFASRLMVAHPSPHEEGADNSSRTGNAHLGSDDGVDANVFLFDDDESVGWNHGSGSKGYELAPDTSGAYGGCDNVGPLDDIFGSMQDMSIQDPEMESSSRLSNSVLNSIFAAVDGERRTVLPPPTLDDTTGMYFMEEYQSPGSEDDASERLDTPTRDDGLLSKGVLDVTVDATKPPALDLPLALTRPAASSVCDQGGGAPPPIDSGDEDNYEFPQQFNKSVDPPNAEGVHQSNNEEAKQKSGGHEVMNNVDCEIQISIHTDDSSSSSSEGNEIKAEEKKAGADDQACNVDDTNAPADMQVPESVFVPIDLESLRARGVNVNASPPREFRVSIATQDSSSSSSSASSSSSCSKANDGLGGDAENGLQDQDTNTEGDAERISPKSIAATSDAEFPSQSQTTSQAAESVASRAVDQAAASEIAPANFDDEKIVAMERDGTAKPRTETDNAKNKAEDELEVQMECSYVAKPASTSLTDSVDCTPLVFRKKGQQTKGAAAAAARRKVLFSPESMTTQESTGMSTGGRKIARSTGIQNLNLSTTQGLLDTPDKSTVDIDEENEIFCAICHCSNSPDSDPIVLCDGDGNGQKSGPCNLAVHQSCYNVGSSLDTIDEWQCDRCQYSASSSKIKPTCSICRQTGGALQMTPGNEKAWVHSICVFWSQQYANMLSRSSKDRSVPDDGFCGDLCTVQDLSEASFSWVPSVRCGFCSKDRAVKCHVGGCQASAHPYCATNADLASSRWTLLHHKGKDNGAGVDDSSGRMWWQMFCPNHTDQATQALTRFCRLPKSKHTEGWSRPCLKCAYYNGRGEDIAFCGADADGDRTSNGKSKPSRKRRIRKKKTSNSTEIDLTGDSPRKKLKGSPDKKPANKSGKDKLRDRVSIFFDTEAAIDSGDEDGSDEEKELRALEEDELSHDSFINDSSQLGSCSQDDLDKIRENIGACAPRNDASNAALHRELDARRERDQEFATPMLNRRRKNRSRDDDSMGLSQSVDSAQRGLGNMAFIRSVLDHHKAGGDCDQIEEEYHRLAQETDGSNADNDHQKSQPQPNKNDSARTSASAAPVHQQAPGQGQQSSTGNASSSFFAPRQKSAAVVPVAAAPVMQSASLGHDLWEAHATANRREAGIAIPTNALNKGRPALATNPLAMHGNERRPNRSNHLIHSSAPIQPPRAHGTVIDLPNATCTTGHNAGLAPTASANRPAQSSGGKGAGITEEQRARMEENRRKALLRKQQRQQQQHQG